MSAPTSSTPPRAGGFAPPDATPAFRRGVLTVNLALAAAFWLGVFAELKFEWSVSEQYAYGLFVPFLGAYLLWLRLPDRPPPRRPAIPLLPVVLIAVFAALAAYPLSILYAANADWRLLAWIQASLAFAVTVALLGHWGGRPWITHFVPALILFLFAVPWPSGAQITLVDSLMGLVAAFSTDLLNLLGFDAIQQGNIIKLPNGYVQVEEACSGVRSVQSTIMAGWLVGELWRFRVAGRLGLLLWAGAVAVLFNLSRTFVLSWLTALHGPNEVARWHDLAGYLVFGLSFVVVLGGAWISRPRHLPAVGVAPLPSTPPPAWLPIPWALGILIVLAGSWPACAAWYKWVAPTAAADVRWSLDLPRAVPNAKPQPPIPGLQQALFYDDGEQAAWTDTRGQSWFLYYFAWAYARGAQLGGVHVPERCLPSVGWVLERQGPDLVWRGHGLEIIFNTYVFVHGPSRIFVFYGQWDPAAYPYHQKIGRSRADRIDDAFTGQLKQDKRLLEVGLQGPPTLEDATAAMQRFLDDAITATPASVLAPR